MDIFGRVVDPQGRAQLAERFHGLHAGAEAVLQPILAAVEGLDFAARRRTPLIERDLARLGRRPPEPCPMVPPASMPEALGLMYVLEGSSLGGRVIRKKLLKVGQDMTGLGFLDPYGAAVADRWRSFLAILDRECPPTARGRGTAAVRGALRGFERARTWLRAPETV